MKAAAISLIMIFSFFLAISLVEYKKNQRIAVNDLIYAYEKIVVMLLNLNCETDQIIANLKNDTKLKKYDFDKISDYIGFDKELLARVNEDLNYLGKYDNKTQVGRLKESIFCFKEKEKELTKYLSDNTKLYYVICLSSGITISLFII